MVRKAEGLGLDVADMIGVTNKARARNRPAYFTKLCVNRLKDKLPGVSEKLLRDALWGEDKGPYTAVTNLLLGVRA